MRGASLSVFLAQTSELLLTVLVSVRHGRRPPDGLPGRRGRRGGGRGRVEHESRPRDCIAGTRLARLLLGRAQPRGVLLRHPVSSLKSILGLAISSLS